MANPDKAAEIDSNVYGKRSRYRTKARNVLRRAARGVRKFRPRPLAPNTVFLPYPKPHPRDLGDFAARATWYLGRWSRDADLDVDVQIPEYLDQSIDIRQAERSAKSGAPRHYLVWRVTPRTALRALLQPYRFTLVDSSLSKTADRDGYLEVADRLGVALSESFAAKAPGDRSAAGDALAGRSALVLGTGPSAAELQGEHEQWDYRIVCNSAIRDAELMERLRPTHICFGDPVFHAGPSAYAGVFRKDLERVAELYDSVLVVPAYCAPGLAANMPWAKDRLLALDLVNDDAWNIPRAESLNVRNTGNVLTMQMMPMAIALASKIDVAGADGRKPEERYFWTHSNQHQYSDSLMRSVFTAHPAFFRDTDYQDYYEQHCETVDSLVAHAESMGCTIRTITTSYIPALAARMS